MSKLQEKPSDTESLSPQEQFAQFIAGKLLSSRQLAQLSLRNVADRFKISGYNPPPSISALNNYERGLARIPADILFELSKIYGVPMTDFYPLSIPTETPTQALILESQTSIKFFLALKSFSKQKREELYKSLIDLFKIQRKAHQSSGHEQKS